MILLGPSAICRLDDRLLARVRRGEDLGPVAMSSVVVIVGGAATYGVAFGLWRGVEQALYSALKLPALLLAIGACTIGLGAMVASLMRSRLSFRQTSVCILLALAVTAAVLGVAAPISVLFAVTAPPPDPSVVGLRITDPRVLPSLHVARGLLVVHVTVVALAGMAGVVRLRGLLTKLGLAPIVIRRVLVSWMATELLCGAQLSWLMRPFFGRPHLAPSFSCDDLLVGNFFEEVEVSMRSAFGPLEAPLGGLALFALVVVLVHALRLPPDRVTIELGDVGLLVDGGARLVRWPNIVGSLSAGSQVHIELRVDESLERDVLVVACRDEGESRALSRRIEQRRTRERAGPFRTSSEGGEGSFS